MEEIEIVGLALDKGDPCLSSGLTLLNLAVSDRPDVCLRMGEMVQLIGESDTGKTLLATQFLAEAAHNPLFDDHLLLCVDTENGNGLPLLRMFGKKTADRVRYPMCKRKKERVPVKYVEELQHVIEDLLEQDIKFVMVVDSIVNLGCLEARKKMMKTKKDYESKGESSGDMAMQKAKAVKAFLSQTINRLPDTDSIIVFTNQGTEKIETGMVNPFAEKKMVAAGGTGPRFNAHIHIELWNSSTIKEKVNGTNRAIGHAVRCKLQKNRTTGKKHQLYFEAYPSYGIDDIGSLVNTLVKDGYWKETKVGGKKVINTGDAFDVTLPQEKLISHIDKNGLMPELQMVALEWWEDIQNSLDIKITKGRTPKYAQK